MLVDLLDHQRSLSNMRRDQLIIALESSGQSQVNADVRVEFFHNSRIAQRYDGETLDR